jgi:endonuclease/exonuclease/phosphatase family metal-dependent hydrolase
VKSKLSKLPLTRGKCNGFMARRPYPFQLLYLSHGSKRLLYRIVLEEGLTLYFTHLALGKRTRTLQLKELRGLADNEPGDVLIAGDFNILAGLEELDTFTLMGRHYLLDLCIASRGAAAHTKVRIIDQPFSDHDALLVEVER